MIYRWDYLLNSMSAGPTWLRFLFCLVFRYICSTKINFKEFFKYLSVSLRDNKSHVCTSSISRLFNDGVFSPLTTEDVPRSLLRSPHRDPVDGVERK